MTTPPTVGSLCTGYGGLDHAIAHLWPPNRLAWCSEIDPAANRLLANRYPDVPNLGDFTTAPTPEPVDILTAGFPCQPASHAGNRRGTTDERWLWPAIADFVARLHPRPSLVVLENVPGLYTVNDGAAWHEVSTSLVSLGYAVRHGKFTAADLGAAHRRARVFVVATRGNPPTPPPTVAVAATEVERLLPTPAASDGSRGPDLARAARPESGGMDLVTTVERLLPTPTAQDASGSRRSTARRDHWKSNPGTTLNDVAHADTFGDYAAAITRHTALVGREPPPPRTPGGRLSPRFVEWLMALPDGWVTGPLPAGTLFAPIHAPRLPRAAALRLLGNGVVPPQAAHAVATLLHAPNERTPDP